MTESKRLFSLEGSPQFCLRTQSKTLPDCSGVYVITTHLPRRKLGEIVYVGKAINIRKRWETHDKKQYFLWRYKKIYLYVLFPGIAESELNDKEKEVTRKLKPRENYLNNAQNHRPAYQDSGKVLQFKPVGTKFDF
ncbi:MAG: GIY-YIG nuclease family protein [Nodosilinea sp. WJT8-NPBG4]|jgi:excinuclease UvrABC nuclease subunit|nr:GIY-YIG nuclease family protein [Nodosilinea sp. WJT8-NPBG4]